MLMIKKITLFISVVVAVSAGSAQSPVIDGSFDGEAVWGVPVGTGDGVEGWAKANARELYVCWDDNYVYFGAECRAEDWQQFIFVVNTKPGGSSTDPWGRQITYNHSNRPDYLFRGDIGKSNYAEYHIWNGTAWANTGNNINSTGTEVKGGFNGSTREGFIEIRVPRATVENVPICDVQFIIGGDNNSHGNFDAIPNDNNGTSWDPPGNFTIVSNYVTNVLLPARLGTFAGELRGGTVTLQWNTLAELTLAGFGIERSADARNWQNVGYVVAHNTPNGGNYRFSHPKAGASVSFYRLKITDKDGKFVHSKMVVIKSENTRPAELIGNPVVSSINVAIHNPAAERIHAELVDMNGRRISNTVYEHPGGSSVLQIPAVNLGSGAYLLRLNGTQTRETMRIMKVK